MLTPYGAKNIIGSNNFMQIKSNSTKSTHIQSNEYSVGKNISAPQSVERTNSIHVTYDAKPRTER